MMAFGPWRGNRKRILRRIAAGVAALVTLAASWTCLSAPAPSPPQGAADPAQAFPTAPAVQTPPVTTKKPAAAPQRARNATPAADAPNAFSAAKPDFRREPTTGSLRPAARQPAVALPSNEAIFAPFLAPVPSGLPAYRPARADAPAESPTLTPSAATSDRRAAAAAETAPPPRPTPARVSRVTPVEEPPLMSPLRWLFVAWGGALALGSAIRMLL